MLWPLKKKKKLIVKKLVSLFSYIKTGKEEEREILGEPMSSSSNDIFFFSFINIFFKNVFFFFHKNRWRVKLWVQNSLGTLYLPNKKKIRVKVKITKEKSTLNTMSMNMEQSWLERILLVELKFIIQSWILANFVNSTRFG